MIHDWLAYEPKIGCIYWIKGKHKGKEAGSWNWNHNDYHRRVSFKGKQYLGHRLAWYLHTGDWPEGEIDHINRDPGDNRWENLRDVSRSDNMLNAKVSKRSRYYPNYADGLKGKA